MSNASGSHIDPNVKHYIVEPGETLTSIARKFNMSVATLIVANADINNPNLIFPGQVIHIP